MPSQNLCRVVWLGEIGYLEAHQLQLALVEKVHSGQGSNTMLMVEHPHVYTKGRLSRESDVLLPEEELAAKGIPVYETDRGGQVTYHGPGQLVGYPILDLKPDRKDAHRYLRDLESVLVHTLGEMGIQGESVPDLTGVWVDGRKIAAIGVRISSGWITSHGFALNVSNDLSFFETIVPCGIQDVSVTSVSQELGRPVGVPDILAIVSRAFSEVFGRSIY